MAEVERRFPNVLVVIGVHSPKYTNEKVAQSVRSAVQRYEIEHPVVSDPDMEVWSSYSVRAWPTLMFLDPEGRVIGKHEGEASADDLSDVIAAVVERYEAEGLLRHEPIEGLAPMKPPSGPLAFPGKVLADAARDRLFIADSGHNRIVVTALDGSGAWTIGSGEPGLKDGDTTTARFHQPEGFALDGDTLYVADRRNHAIRRIDLAGRSVQTIAGTGMPGMGFIHHGPARSVDMRSPWDLALHGGVLYVAMAGTHQLWALDIEEEYLRPYAGTGHEGIKDGSVGRAWLAQPSGLDTDGRLLYFADSETSAIRTAELPPGDEVRTIVGTGLFDFGDVDGIGTQAVLQHPLGVAIDGDVLYITDSYNHKIKRIFLPERRVESWLGNGEPGEADGVDSQAQFDEPGGLSVGGRKLYIADTNNHAIRVADLATGAVTTLRVEV